MRYGRNRPFCDRRESTPFRTDGFPDSGRTTNAVTGHPGPAEGPPVAVIQNIERAVPYRCSEDLLHPDVACLAPIRIVWRTVNSVANSIAIAITLVPAPALQLPSVIALGPRRLSQVVACAFTLPVPGLPPVTITVRVPISRRPHTLSNNSDGLSSPRWRPIGLARPIVRSMRWLRPTHAIPGAPAA